MDLYGTAVALRPIEASATESDGSNSLSMGLTRYVQDKLYSDTSRNAHLTLKLRPCFEGEFTITNDGHSNRVIYYARWKAITYDSADASVANRIRVNRLDTENNIVSGIFNCTLVSKKTGEKIEITEGRFDTYYFPD